MIIKEENLTDGIARQLIALSDDWEKENLCNGYRKNGLNDFEGKRIFLATEKDEICGYLFGHSETAQKNTSVYNAGTCYFEIDELYVKPPYRNRGIGKKLFRYVEQEIASDADIIKLNTSTENFKAILRFYIDELGMEFWSATLFKRIK